MPSGEGERSRHQLMADSMSVMWMAAMVVEGGKDTRFDNAAERASSPTAL